MFPPGDDNQQAGPPGAMPEQNQPPQEPIPDPRGTQLELSEPERDRIREYIRQEYWLAVDDNNQRMTRCRLQERLWREKVGIEGGEQGKSNLRIPETTKLLLSKHARELDALFGRGASVVASPIGPSDVELSQRISIGMTWKVFESMQAMKPIAVWALNRLKFGRAFAYVPHRSRFYSKFASGKKERIKYKSGPEVIPLDADQLIFPAEAVSKVQEFSWCIRRYWSSPADLLADERESELYSGIEESWQGILDLAKKGIRRDTDRDKVQLEKDWAQGVQRDDSPSIKNTVEVWECYMRWRMPVSEQNQSGYQQEGSEEELTGAAGRDEMQGDESNETAGKRSASVPLYNQVTGEQSYVDYEGVEREMEETDIVVRMIPELGDGVVVGAQRLDELFPDTPRKWPILEAALMNDGSYWCMGLVELAEEIEKEITVAINLLIESGQFGIKPLIFYEPAAGQALETFKYEPGQAIPKAPQSKVDVVNITPSPEVTVILLNYFKEVIGDLTGITGTVLGRTFGQPNAPKTLGQTRMLAGASDVRLALDMRMLSEDLKEFLGWIWDLWTMFETEDETFFRVAEGKANGLFQPNEIVGGFVKLGARERAGKYDFKLEFADDMQTREGKKHEALAVLQAGMSSALFQSDPVAQYRLLADVFNAFSLDISKYLAEPPQIFTPRKPEQEWTMALQGDDFHVHPMDNDDAHISDHEQRLVAEMNKPPERGERDEDAVKRMMDHIIEHQQAKVQKQQAQAMTQALAGMANATLGGQPSANPLQTLLGGGGPPQQEMPQ